MCGCDGTGQVWHGHGALTYITRCPECAEHVQAAWDDPSLTIKNAPAPLTRPGARPTEEPREQPAA